MTPQDVLPEPDATSMHIMLVDDEDDYHLITRMMLKKAGFRGRFSSFLDPAKAIEHLRNSQDQPDLLLVDINMPATDGFQFLESCKRDTLIKCDDTTVVMCSSSNRPVDMEMARQVHCVREYIEKPLTTEQFTRIAIDHTQRKQARQ